MRRRVINDSILYCGRRNICFFINKRLIEGEIISSSRIINEKRFVIELVTEESIEDDIKTVIENYYNKNKYVPNINIGFNIKLKNSINVYDILISVFNTSEKEFWRNNSFVNTLTIEELIFNREKIDIKKVTLAQSLFYIVCNIDKLDWDLQILCGKIYRYVTETKKTSCRCEKNHYYFYIHNRHKYLFLNDILSKNKSLYKEVFLISINDYDKNCRQLYTDINRLYSLIE